MKDSMVGTWKKLIRRGCFIFIGLLYMVMVTGGIQLRKNRVGGECFFLQFCV